MQVCLSVKQLTNGDTPNSSVNMRQVLSVVSEDLHNDGAKTRLIAAVDPTGERARPKLVGFHARDDPSNIKWALYLNKRVLFDDAFHLTKSLAMALINLEIVRMCSLIVAYIWLHVRVFV